LNYKGNILQQSNKQMTKFRETMEKPRE